MVVCNLIRDPQWVQLEDEGYYSYPYDVTARFTGDGSSLLISYLAESGETPLSGRLAKTSMFTLDAAAQTVYTRKLGIDQPQLRVIPDPTSDLYVIGANMGYRLTNAPFPCANFGMFGSLFPTPPVSGQIPPGRASLEGDVCAAPRNRLGGTGFRIAAHSDGTVYGAYYLIRPRSESHFDVVVVRGDPAYHGSTSQANLPMSQLRDLPKINAASRTCKDGDGEVGSRVARCITYEFDEENNPAFGCQTRGSAISIAVHPLDNKTVYVAWGDESAGMQTLHVKSSHNGGALWSVSDVLTVPHGNNPTLAVSASGRVAMLYQTLVTSSAGKRWETRIDVGGANFVAKTSTVLAVSPVTAACLPDTPYLGDYLDLSAAGETFYGVFTAPNDASITTFHGSASFRRRMVAGRPVDLSGVPVAESVDPYFFTVRPM